MASVLVVDDDAGIRESAVLALRKVGHRTYEAEDAATARRLLKEHPYELVLCDGDDQTDESMFEIEAPHLISIKVGPHASRAQYRLANPAGFRKLLRSVLL